MQNSCMSARCSSSSEDMLPAQPLAPWVRGCLHSALWARRGFVQLAPLRIPLVACGDMRTWGAKGDPGAEPPSQLQPKSLVQSRHFFEFPAFWVLQCNDNGDVEIPLCPLGVTFVQGSCSHFQSLEEGRQQKAGPAPKLAPRLTPLERKCPWHVLQPSLKGEIPFFSLLVLALVRGCMVTIRKRGGFGVVWMFAHP